MDLQELLRRIEQEIIDHPDTKFVDISNRDYEEGPYVVIDGGYYCYDCEDSHELWLIQYPDSKLTAEEMKRLMELVSDVFLKTQ